MRILITGRAGFIGSNMIRYLLSRYPYAYYEKIYGSRLPG